MLEKILKKLIKPDKITNALKDVPHDKEKGELNPFYVLMAGKELTVAAMVLRKQEIDGKTELVVARIVNKVDLSSINMDDSLTSLLD